MRIYPVAGLSLRDPVKGDFIPDEGREVEDSPYWRRRLSCGDASRTPPAAVAALPDVTHQAAAEVEPEVPGGDAE